MASIFIYRSAMAALSARRSLSQDMEEAQARISSDFGSDMNEELIRLKALQRKQQPSIQSLSVASSSATAILALFK